ANDSISFLHSKTRQAGASLDEVAVEVAGRLQADPWFDGEETQQRLQQAVGLLPEKQRAVFVLRYYDEMPYEEMSAVLDTSVGALKASFHHAAKKIETFFRENE
ncbi:MAG: RNA polymerase sigma factor, partial [Saprospiraceae bacterium]